MRFKSTMLVPSVSILFVFVSSASPTSKLFSQDEGEVRSVSTFDLSGCQTTGKSDDAFVWKFDGPAITIVSEDLPDDLLGWMIGSSAPFLHERSAELTWTQSGREIGIALMSKLRDREDPKLNDGTHSAQLKLRYQRPAFLIAGNIPQDIINSVLGDDYGIGEIHVIQGTWKIDEWEIVLTDIVVNGHTKIDSTAKLEIFANAVIYINTDDGQYKF